MLASIGSLIPSFILSFLFLIYPTTTQAIGSSITDPIEINPLISHQSCIVSGCSGQLCVDTSTGPVYTTCEWKDEYACYQHSRCERQPNGNCGWTQTPDLRACLQELGTATPTPANPTPFSPVCGNGVCEAGEADPYCPPCIGVICTMMACAHYEGTCPQDCLTPEPTTTPNPTPTPTRCIPRPACLDTQPACQLLEPAPGWCPPVINSPTPTPCTHNCFPTPTSTPQPTPTTIIPTLTNPSPTLLPPTPSPTSTPILNHPSPYTKLIKLLESVRQSFRRYFKNPFTE